MSSKCPTLFDCLREFGQRIQRDHGPTFVDAVKKMQDTDENAVSTKRPVNEGADSFNATEVLMLHTKAKIIQEQVAQTNKRPNLGSGDVYRFANFGHRRRRDTWVLDTTGS